MSHADQRLVEFLIHSEAIEMAALPDWFLALVEGDGGNEPSPELITAASFLFVRRQQPGITFGDAQRVLASYARDPARLDDLMARIHAFRLSCGFERLQRAGFYEAVSLGDPFDLDGQVSVTLTEESWRLFHSNPSKHDIHLHLQKRWGAN